MPRSCALLKRILLAIAYLRPPSLKKPFMGQAFRPTPQEKFLYCGIGVPPVGENAARPLMRKALTTNDESYSSSMRECVNA